jgi:hypothetical protein
MNTAATSPSDSTATAWHALASDEVVRRLAAGQRAALDPGVDRVVGKHVDGAENRRRRAPRQRLPGTSGDSKKGDHTDEERSQRSRHGWLRYLV